MQLTRTSTPRTARRLLGDVRRIVRTIGTSVRRASRHADRPSSPGLSIGTIADPELDMYLVSVRGAVTWEELRTLESELRSFERDTILHLDVTDADFSGPAAYTGFEALIESLEHRRVRIRIVGLRPPVPSRPTD